MKTNFYTSHQKANTLHLPVCLLTNFIFADLDFFAKALVIIRKLQLLLILNQGLNDNRLRKKSTKYNSNNIHFKIRYAYIEI